MLAHRGHREFTLVFTKELFFSACSIPSVVKYFSDLSGLGILGLYEIQVCPYCAVGGIDNESFPPLFFGEAVKALRIIGDAEVQARRDIFGVALLGMIEFLDRGVVQPLITVSDTEAGDDVREVRREAEGLLV